MSALNQMYNSLSKNLKDIFLSIKYTPGESEELIKEIQNGNKDAIWDFVLQNTHYILDILYKYFPKYIDDASFIDGIHGAYRAASYFDKDYTMIQTYSYLRKSVIRSIREGIRFRVIPLSPISQLTKNYSKNKKQLFLEFRPIHDEEFISDDKFKDTNNDIYEEIYEFDNIQLSKQIVDFLKKHNKDFNKHFNILQMIVENEGNKAQVGRKLGVTRANISLIKQNVRKSIIKTLNRNPKLKEDLYNSLNIKEN